MNKNLLKNAIKIFLKYCLLVPYSVMIIQALWAVPIPTGTPETSTCTIYVLFL